MKVARVVATVAMVSAAALLGGCKQEFKLTFVNTTSQTLNVELSVPSQGVYDLGYAGAGGGRLTHKLKIEKDELPATCYWRAGSQSSAFTLSEDMDKQQTIYIEPGGHTGPIDKNTEVQKETHIEIEGIELEPQEVVE